MSILNSNHSHFSPAEHTFFRNFVKCDFCDVAHDEEFVSKVDGYDLCIDCQKQYEEDQKENAILSEANLINIKYSGDVNAPF